MKQSLHIIGFVILSGIFLLCHNDVSGQINFPYPVTFYLQVDDRGAYDVNGLKMDGASLSFTGYGPGRVYEVTQSKLPIGSYTLSIGAANTNIGSVGYRQAYPGGELVYELPFSGNYTKYQNYFYGRWAYKMSRPARPHVSDYSTQICGNQRLGLNSDYNWPLFTDSYVAASVVWEYDINGNNNWRAIDSSNIDYWASFIPAKLIPEIRTVKCNVRFRCRAKAQYATATYYSPMSDASAAIEISPGPPAFDSLDAVKTPACYGMSNGSIYIPGNRIYSSFSTMRWILRPGNVTQPCDPGLSSGSSNCGDMIAWSDGVVPVSDGININARLPAGKYTLWLLNPGQDAGNCLTPVVLTIDQLNQLRITQNTTQSKSVTCPGGSDGAIAVFAAGGEYPKSSYYFTLTTKDNVVVRTEAAGTGVNMKWTDLPAGDYKAIVRDTRCGGTSINVTVGGPPAPKGELTVVQPTCFGQGNGSIGVVASVTGGTAPSSYKFILFKDNARKDSATVNANTYAFNGLSGGTYIVEIRSGQYLSCPGWRDTVQLDVLNPLALQTGTPDSVSCYGGSDGRLQCSATGGSGRYTFTLSGNGVSLKNNTGLFEGLSAGAYTIKLTNEDAACSDEVVQVVNVYQRGQLDATLQVTPVTCYQADNGKLKAVVSGGSGSYSYTWQEWKNNTWSENPFWFSTDIQIVNLSPGTYRVIISDNKSAGCTDTVMAVTLDDVAPLVINNITVHDAVCLAEGASIEMTATGGDGNYTYQWSLDGGANFEPFTSTTAIHSAGQYQLRVSDGKGCITDAAASYTIILPAEAFAYTTTLSDYNGFNISCNDASDGKIMINAIGGNGGTYTGYQYKLDEGAYQSAPEFTDMKAGTYTLTVIDGRGCEITTPVTLIQPFITINAAKEDIKCYGAATGSITTNISGGAAPYTLQLNGKQVGVNTTLNDLPAGDYLLHVTDANQCTKDSTISIVYSNPEFIIRNAVVSDIVCYGTFGHITADVAGGDGAYSYALSLDNWATAIPYTNGADLSAGKYALRVTDGQGCTIAYPDYLTITTPAAPVRFTAKLSDYNGYNISCVGGNNGFALITAAGGNDAEYKGYRYALDNGAYSDDNLIQGINAGNHTISVKDARGCEIKTPYTFTASATAINITLVSTKNLKCASTPAGSITVSGNGGVGVLQYTIDNKSWQTSPVFDNLMAGTYTVTVKDINSCTSSIVVNVLSDDPAILIDSIRRNDIVCYGAKGTILMFTHGGSGTLTHEYAYNGTAYKTFNNATPLEAGTYTLRVLDGAGCYSEVAAPVSITAPAAPLDAVISTSDFNGRQISCFGLTDGAFSIAPSGGNGGPYSAYKYSVGNGVYTDRNNYNNLSAGVYAVSIQDGRGCILSKQVSLQQPDALSLGVSDIDHLICGADPTGKIELSATGGTTPYTYALNDGGWQQTPSFGGLTAGQYALAAKDMNGCMAQQTVTVTTLYPAINATAVVAPVLCNAQSNGAIATTVTGGDGSYRYEWSSPQLSGAHVQDLPAGSYTLTVTDGTGCKQVFNYAVTEPNALQLSVTAPAICDGLNEGLIEATATGGTLPYSYALNEGEWTAANTFSELAAGNYRLQVKDGNGCNVSKETVIEKVNIKPDINFLVATRKNALDTLAVKDVSVPAPDAISWTFDPAATLLGYEKGAPLIKFGKPGIYWVTMTGTFGSCTYSLRRELTINPYDPLAGPGYSMPVHVIDTVMLSPNPNDGNFNFKVKLNRNQQVMVYVYDMNGIIADKRQYPASLLIDDRFSLGGTATGTFILRVIAESESRDVRFIISR
ncbi:Por secretion system C-terminal sorting domain-containing protein [Chitinophaga filiformis]|uniref:Por secretion system C-terminal sorting domain-containing protein n=2 Tax=Chitinophaga filiformis TaxID=104663 RepID=A0A1G7RKH9_CHIFI|nr:Por secretion system C-terminal sorting domain-containing protein [Chitinophaga filiformis]